MANDRPTAELPVVPADGRGAAEDPEAHRNGAADLPPLDDDWLSEGPPKGFRLRVPTAVIVALLVAAGAFWDGAVAEKHHGTATAAGGRGGAPSALLGRGLGGAAGGAIEGTVSAVKGDTLTVTESSGTKVKVKLTSSTTVTRTTNGAAGAAKKGDTAVVIGTSASGTITATRVTLIAKGATAGPGGLGSGGFGGFSGTAGGSGSGTFGGAPGPNGSATSGSGTSGSGTSGSATNGSAPGGPATSGSGSSTFGTPGPAG